MSSKFESRLAELEARVAELERREAPEQVDAAPSTGGIVAYQGDVHLHGTVRWDISYSADASSICPLPRYRKCLLHWAIRSGCRSSERCCAVQRTPRIYMPQWESAPRARSTTTSRR
ncbi:hypothetical protein [Rhodococcus sp. BS-15]|uniref:hypothetical protein n=1 Tax=Rhodococcus sp. BS-15 TaxID=1304954 RepID=UPI001F1EE94C|nr:hypothetical protein [Rhodococcus sp. BS-15]